MCLECYTGARYLSYAGDNCKLIFVVTIRLSSFWLRRDMMLSKTFRKVRLLFSDIGYMEKIVKTWSAAREISLILCSLILISVSTSGE